MNESIIAGVIGLTVVSVTSIYIVVKIQAIRKMRKTVITPLLGVAMPQEQNHKKEKR
jgi:hypothetical protein